MRDFLFTSTIILGINIFAPLIAAGTKEFIFIDPINLQKNTKQL
tara:strand:+ start:1122 stop:1253 length:132 start_codon:yes stop_codon:yes gene_type:complete